MIGPEFFREGDEAEAELRAEVAQLQAENERLRAHIAELDAWQAKGEEIIAPAMQWGPGGNVMWRSSMLFELDAWWADRPLRRNPPTGT